jgi:hypothetical protein
MLLQVVPEEGQDVFPEDIHYYDDPPFDDGNHLAHGVDLAISTKESADYTAIVSGEVTWPGGNIAQAVAGAIVIFSTAYPAAGWLVIAKSIIDIVLRMQTTQSIGSIM